MSQFLRKLGQLKSTGLGRRARELFTTPASFGHGGPGNKKLSQTMEGAGEVLDGATILATSLRNQGIQYAFGVVGIPVIETSVALQQVGIKFVAMRNEQAACYAAQAYGYLSQSPGVCLVVSGPGVIHALGGLANAKANCWPLILVGGACDRPQEELGAFQETNQVEATRMYTKFAARPPTLERIPSYVTKAVKFATYGRPGATYLDFPGDLLNETIPKSNIQFDPHLPAPPITLPLISEVQKAVDLLKSAQRPLVIVGKGASYVRAEKNVENLLRFSDIPFLPTPMGKGLVPDDHTNCVSPARSLALQKADVILLIGEKLDWMLHFGQPPRFNKNVQIIQIDVEPEEFHSNVATEVSLCGDINGISGQIASIFQEGTWRFGKETPWWTELRSKMESNRKTVRAMISDDSVPLNYYAALNCIHQNIPDDSIIVNEGANTMDIGRNVLLNRFPRSRLDAGSYGTMGVGLGFAIAAAFYSREQKSNRRVVCVQGDSAFGFGGMEIETLFRYKLPVICIIINNNGIYGGVDSETWKELREDSGFEPALITPPNCLTPQARYEKMAQICGGKGYYCETIDELTKALKEANHETENPSIINVMINPGAQRKAQDFDWLTRAKL